MNFTSSSWCQLPWTPWVSFNDQPSFKNLPKDPGVYRIRIINGNELFYIGQTGRNLRERLSRLRENTLKEKMPYNDPHTAAPSLWAWRHAEGFHFECSAANIQLADNNEDARRLREGLEAYLLWQYRLELGSSTRCNHGRFHPRYEKSSDRKKGFQGGRLPDNAPDNIAGGPSLAPLSLLSNPFENNWMGLSWSIPAKLIQANVKIIEPSPGVYKIFDPEKKILLYIGESNNLLQRLSSHTRKQWECPNPVFSYVPLPVDTLPYQRHEIENDLIGGFYGLTRKIPKFQFINLH